MQLVGLRRRFREWEIPAVLRTLRAQRDAEIQIMQERRATDAFREREERRRRLIVLKPT